MTLDLTDQLVGVRTRSRRNLAVLILAWAGALGLTTMLVKRSARRSAERLEAELAAAESGETGPLPVTSEIVLDPVASELHKSLRSFLRRQRRHEAEVASRLAHTDQLASLGRLAAGLAHEIKNPLAGIQGALEILRQDLSNDKDRELCSEMLGELKRVNNTLQNLLTSARPSPPQRQPTDASRLMEDIRMLMAPGLKQRGIELVLESAGDVSEMSLDPSQIRQVVINLINNAADALEEGGRITLRTGTFPDGGGIILTVQDDGPGIPPDQARKIFTPFFTTKFSGTGLGLPIARSLVEQHGGTLDFETEPGKGSAFFVLLPAETIDEQADLPGEERATGD